MYDVIIIGSGCSGYAAAMYSGRLNLKTLLIGYIEGGTITLTDTVENYPGFIKLTGPELADKLKEHAMQYPVKMISDSVLGIKKIGNCFKVSTKSRTYNSKTVILATGTDHRKLNIPGEKEFKNRGVHNCSLCDGPIYAHKLVAVIGGSDSAAKEAIFLASYAKKVFMIYRGEKIRPEPINMKKIQNLIKKSKIEIIYNANVKEIKGNKLVTSVILDRPYKKSNELKLDGIFVAVGQIPKSDLAKQIGAKINEKSEVIINKESKTNIPGFFAAGDVADTIFKQAITGVGEAVTASYSAYQYISHTKIMPCSDERKNSNKI